MEAREMRQVTGLCCGPIAHLVLRKEKCEHGAGAVYLDWHACLLGELNKSSSQSNCRGFYRFPYYWFSQDRKGSDSRHHRQGVSGKRPGLVDWPGGGVHLHNITPPAIGSNWQTAADHFTQCRQIRLYIVKRLCTPWVDAETGHDFVEDE